MGFLSILPKLLGLGQGLGNLPITPGANPNLPHPLESLGIPRNPFPVPPFGTIDDQFPGQVDPLAQIQQMIAQLQQPQKSPIQQLLGLIPGGVGNFLENSPVIPQLARAGALAADPQLAPLVQRQQAQRNREDLFRQRTAAQLQSQLGRLQEQRAERSEERKTKAQERQEAKRLRRLGILLEAGTPSTLKAAERQLREDGLLKEGESLTQEAANFIRIALSPEGEPSIVPKGSEQGVSIKIKTADDLKDVIELLRGPSGPEPTTQMRNAAAAIRFLESQGKEVPTDLVLSMLGGGLSKPELTTLQKNIREVERRGQKVTGEMVARAANLLPEEETTEVEGQEALRVLNILEQMSIGKGGINVGGAGTIQKLVGAGRRAAATTGQDDQIALYQSTVRGFVPLFARKVGHTGMLTEEDAKRTEALFPAPGESEKLAEAKFQNIRNIIGAQQGIPGVSDPEDIGEPDSNTEGQVVVRMDFVRRQAQERGMDLDEYIKFLESNNVVIIE